MMSTYRARKLFDDREYAPPGDRGWAHPLVDERRERDWQACRARLDSAIKGTRRTDGQAPWGEALGDTSLYEPVLGDAS